VDPTLEADLGHGSLRERRALLEAGIQMFWENPVMGVGTGLFRVHASYVSAGEVWKIAHNSYLNVAAEQGIPGILSHLYLGFLLFSSIWHCAFRTTTRLAQGMGFGMLVSFAGFCIMALTLNLSTFAVAYYMLGFGLMVGKLGGAERVIDRAEQARQWVRIPRATSRAPAKK
jgi:O-antigen ligase